MATASMVPPVGPTVLETSSPKMRKAGPVAAELEPPELLLKLLVSFPAPPHPSPNQSSGGSTQASGSGKSRPPLGCRLAFWQWARKLAEAAAEAGWPSNGSLSP